MPPRTASTVGQHGSSSCAMLSLAALTMLMCASALKPAPASARGLCADEDVSAISAPASSTRAAVLCLVNETRLLRGLPALQRDDRLESAAQRHTNDMVNNSHALTHTGSDDSDYAQRVAATGYAMVAADSGENIAQGQQTPRMVVEAWLRSPGHCANTLRPGIRDLGVGVNPAAAAPGTAGPSWTQVFARLTSDAVPSNAAAPSCPSPLAAIATGPTPTAATGAATSITASSATINGTAGASGGGFTSYHVEHGTTAAYGSQTLERVADTASATVTEPLSGLAAGTHRFRVVAMNHNGATRSLERVVTTTGSLARPLATTAPAAAVTQTTATLNGSVNPAGRAATYRFEYGTTTSYGSSTPITAAGSDTITLAVSSPVGSLAPATLYHARLVASNGDGTTLGTDVSFTTAAVTPRPPIVVTGSAAVNGTTVTLTGSVNPNAQTTAYQFEYGTTTAYGSITALASAGSGTTALAVSAVVTGLTAATTYHVRLGAGNEDGTRYGANVTFTTGPGPGMLPPTGLPAIGSEPTCAYRSTRLSAQYRSQIVLASICLVNFERVSRGIAPLYVDARLGAAAQGHADDEVRRNFFSHTNPDGCDPLCRASAAGYLLATGENISAGHWTAAAAVGGWMNSDAHRRNVMGASFRTIGAGSAIGGPSGTQWVHMFGTLAPAAGAIHGLEPRFQGRADPTTPSAVPAKLRVSGAHVTRGALRVVAEITRRADGHRLTVTLKARGATTRFATTVRRGRIDVDRRRSRAQRGARSGIVTLRYAGGAGVRRAEARLRAASAKADLRRRTLSLANGVLRAGGTISSRARGIVRLHLEFDTSTGPGEWNGRARVAEGRWSLRQALPPGARRGGYLSVQFTGYGPRGIRGEQIGKQVSAG